MNGVVTDLDGNFSITVPSGSELTVSCIGYDDYVFVLDGRDRYEITLESSSEFLDEVVVVGMDNRQTRRSITGAISTIDTKDLVQSPVENICRDL